MKLGGLSKKFMAGMLSLSMTVGMLTGVGLVGSKEVQAADTADLRLMFTSDIHGQVTTEDYETGRIYTEGGLSRTATLIKQAKAEVNSANSLLFDLGDSLYDYTTDYIYESNSNAIQPIYTAMSKLGYDAVTLGNHDFDYDLNYIKKQLTGSGMAGKVVLSNVTDANTGAHIWAENKIITKNLKTASGQTISVKVGLIGETVPTLSKKRTSYKGVLNGEDIVANVKAQVPKLQKQGADIIVVLAHSGVGEEKPAELDANTGYALTKITGVDAVLCGHLHTDFPSTTGEETKFDNLPGVNLKTGLVNGKPLVQIQNRGASLGVVDLNVSKSGNKVSVASSSTDIRKVTANTEVNQTINGALGSWSKTFLADCSQILSEVDGSTQLQNYFGTMEDSDAIQLLNTIKISYGLRYINTKKTEYKNYPVVAASSYLKYGSSDGDDYVDIQDEFKKSNMYDLVNYRTGLYLYEMTGAQIRTWLEWTAGCYEQAGKNLIRKEDNSSNVATQSALEVQKQDTTLKQLPSLDDILDYDSSKPFQFTLQTDYLEDWSKFFVFDGLEYQIDTRVAPCYDEDGNKINNTKRVTSLTRNGKAIKDTDKFVVMCHRLPDNTLFKTMNPKKIISTSTETYRAYIQDYIEKISMTGTIKPMQDDNWGVTYTDDYNYLLQSSAKAERYVGSKKWLVQSLGGGDSYKYYLANPSKKTTTDTTGPCLSTVIKDESETNKTVAVLIQATDKSGIASIRYAEGKYSASNAVWKTATKLTGNVLNCAKNEVYSICATDGKGNNTVNYVKITNINKSMLAAPVVDTYTNRKTSITGKAEAGAVVYFKIESGKTYSTTATSKGTFSYKLPPQKAGTRIFVYVVDSKGMTSARTIVTVKRTGPNKPKLSKVYTNKKTVTGNVNDTYAYPMVLVGGKTIYVPNANVKALYKKSTYYKKKYKVVVGRFTLSNSGKFTLTLPDYLKAKTTVELKTVDAVARASLATHVNVTQAKPVLPTVGSVSNMTKTVKVYTKEKCTKAGVKIGKKTYTATKASYNKKSKKYCFKVKTGRKNSNQLMKIYVVNAKGRSTAVKLYPKQKAPDTPTITKAKIGSKKVTGKVTAAALAAPKGKVATIANTKTKVVLTLNGKKYKGKIKADGTFVIKTPKLEKGDKFTIIASNRLGKSKAKKGSAKKK